MLAYQALHKGTNLQGTKHWCQCWKISRTDGTIFRFTDHDRELRVAETYGTFTSLQTYTPVKAMDASSLRREDKLREHEFEVKGVLDSDIITDDDLRSGLFREAIILQMTVDWKIPWTGAIQSSKYWVHQTTHDSEIWVVELQGPTRFLKNRVGDVFSRTCEADLGDAKCKFNLAGSTVTPNLAATVTSVKVFATEDGAKRRIIYANTSDLAGSYPDGYFEDGVVTATSGLNAGHSREIKTYEAGTRRIVCQLEFPHPFSTNDNLTVVVGCNKLKGTCVTLFGNILNYRGFDSIPGTDRVLQTPLRG